MSQSTLVNARLNAPLRSLALTVEERAPGEFFWRILESHADPLVFESLSCSDTSFTAYDSALATGYGELQRVIGPDLQYGPRRDEPQQVDLFGVAASAEAAKKGLATGATDTQSGRSAGIQAGAVPA
ncbi:MAG: hypothetical protein ABIR76_10610 [Polaromonas sp.]